MFTPDLIGFSLELKRKWIENLLKLYTNKIIEFCKPDESKDWNVFKENNGNFYQLVKYILNSNIFVRGLNYYKSTL